MFRLINMSIISTLLQITVNRETYQKRIGGEPLLFERQRKAGAAALLVKSENYRFI